MYYAKFFGQGFEANAYFLYVAIPDWTQINLDFPKRGKGYSELHN